MIFTMKVLIFLLFPLYSLGDSFNLMETFNVQSIGVEEHIESCLKEKGHESALTDFFKCSQEAMNLLKNNNMDIGSHLELVCKKVEEFNCFVDLRNVLKGCIDDDQLAILDLRIKTYKASLKYSCENNAARVKEFFETQSHVCYDEKKKELDQCTMDTGYRMNNIAFQFRKYQKDECRKLKTFQDCADKAVKSCNSTYAAEFLHGLLLAVLKELPCYESLQYEETGNGATAERNLYTSLLMVLYFVIFVIKEINS